MTPAAPLFSNAQLDKLTTELLPARAPGNHDNAVVFDIDQKTGAKIAGHLEFKQGRWVLEGAYLHEWNGNDTAAGRGIFTWPSKP